MLWLTNLLTAFPDCPGSSLPQLTTETPGICGRTDPMERLGMGLRDLSLLSLLSETQPAFRQINFLAAQRFPFLIPRAAKE